MSAGHLIEQCETWAIYPISFKYLRLSWDKALTVWMFQNNLDKGDVIMRDIEALAWQSWTVLTQIGKVAVLTFTSKLETKRSKCLEKGEMQWWKEALERCSGGWTWKINIEVFQLQGSSSGSEGGGGKLVLVRGKPELGDDRGFSWSPVGKVSEGLAFGLSEGGV